MFILIVQNRFTHRFLGEGNEWTHRRADAKTFESGADVIAYCFEHKIEGYQLVLHFDDSSYDLETPSEGKAQ